MCICTHARSHTCTQDHAHACTHARSHTCTCTTGGLGGASPSPAPSFTGLSTPPTLMNNPINAGATPYAFGGGGGDPAAAAAAAGKSTQTNYAVTNRPAQ